MVVSVQKTADKKCVHGSKLYCIIFVRLIKPIRYYFFLFGYMFKIKPVY